MYNRIKSVLYYGDISSLMQVQMYLLALPLFLVQVTTASAVTLHDLMPPEPTTIAESAIVDMEPEIQLSEAEMIVTEVGDEPVAAEPIVTAIPVVETQLPNALSTLSEYQLRVLRHEEKLTKSTCEALMNPDMRDRCMTYVADLNIEVAERQQIYRRSEEGTLTAAYCGKRYNPRNWTLCQSMLDEEQLRIQQELHECRVSDVDNRITIDLTKQVLYAVKNCELVVYTKIVSGKFERETPTGVYDFYMHRKNHIMRYPQLYEGEYPVDNALYFLGAYALHDANWRSAPYWDAEDRYTYGSNGCVNTPPERMREIVQNFGIGDEIYLTYKVDPWHQMILDRLVGGRVPYDPDPTR